MSASKKLTIADNIKKYRQNLGISQDRLSKMADVTYNTMEIPTMKETGKQRSKKFIPQIVKI
jgi:predicted transcriptional regulator